MHINVVSSMSVLDEAYPI